jgi:predicted DNA repair protein MutK
MPSGLAALLDDIATIAKVAAASVDDVAAAAGKAGSKAAGVVIDDTAVTPQWSMSQAPSQPRLGRCRCRQSKRDRRCIHRCR